MIRIVCVHNIHKSGIRTISKCVPVYREPWSVVGIVTSREKQSDAIYLDSAEVGDRESWLSLKSPKMIVGMAEYGSSPR